MDSFRRYRWWDFKIRDVMDSLVKVISAAEGGALAISAAYINQPMICWSA
jgi:hypothetical protein